VHFTPYCRHSAEITTAVSFHFNGIEGTKGNRGQAVKKKEKKSGKIPVVIEDKIHVKKS